MRIRRKVPQKINGLFRILEFPAKLACRMTRSVARSFETVASPGRVVADSHVVRENRRMP